MIKSDIKYYDDHINDTDSWVYYSFPIPVIENEFTRELTDTDSEELGLN